MRNVLSFVLVLTMSGLVFGFAGGDGSSSAPYQVSTVADIDAIDAEPDASYIMINDIDLVGITYDKAPIGALMFDEESEPIGTAFEGTFDGAGYVIKNLSVTDTEARAAGLFGTVSSSAVVQNLGIEGASVSANSNAGSLVGNTTGSIFNCYLSYTPGDPNNSVVGTVCVGGLIGVASTGANVTDCWAETDVTGESQVGGLIGQSRESITNCYAISRVKATIGTDAYAGGLIGLQFSGTVSDCYATGKVTATGIRIGGLVGQLGYTSTTGSTIDNCYATGDVKYTGITTGISYVGGLVGLAGLGDISDCYATGDVDGGTGQRAGGLVAQTNKLVENCYATGSVSGLNTIGGVVAITGDTPAKVKNCYATGTVTGDATVGGVAGLRYRGGIYECFWDTETSGTTVGVGSGGGEATGKTTAEMKTKSTFTDAGWPFDFNNPWLMPQITPEFEGYPVLAWQVGLSMCDFNQDGIVDMADFVVFSGEWLSEAY